MREILFRGKRISNGEWIEGGILKQFHPNFKCKTEKDFLEQNPNCYCICANNKDYFVEQNTIGQYTGLEDRNGRKIFEGDIVKRTDLHTTREPSIGFIEYDMDNTSFLIHWIDVVNYSATFPWKDKIEVIGNIFDNSIEGNTKKGKKSSNMRNAWNHWKESGVENVRKVYVLDIPER